MDNNGNNRNGDYQTIGSKRLKVVSHRLQTSQFCNCIGRSKTQYIADIEVPIVEAMTAMTILDYYLIDRTTQL